MLQNSFRKIILPFIIFIVFVVGALITVQYIQSHKTIEIKFSNISNVSLVESRTLKPFTTVAKSGEKITVSKDVKYKITYKGDEGYAGGEIDIDNRKDSIEIKPYYSIEKLESLLTDADVNSIRNKIKDTYLPNTLNSYSIERGRLYHFGDWYSTSLTYNQDYNDVSDTLHIIAKKTVQGWEIVADPNITFNRFNNPTIPVDILQAVNSQSD